MTYNCLPFFRLDLVRIKKINFTAAGSLPETARRIQKTVDTACILSFYLQDAGNRVKAAGRLLSGAAFGIWIFLSAHRRIVHGRNRENLRMALQNMNFPILFFK